MNPVRVKHAKDFKAGDVVAFINPNFNYTVEYIEYTEIGMVRHRHSNDTASSCYWPNELLYTV